MNRIKMGIFRPEAKINIDMDTIYFTKKVCTVKYHNEVIIEVIIEQCYALSCKS